MKQRPDLLIPHRRNRHRFMMLGRLPSTERIKALVAVKSPLHSLTSSPTARAISDNARFRQQVMNALTHSCLDQRLRFGLDPRVSAGISQLGWNCAKECVLKTGLLRRLSLIANMMASKNPVSAPRHPSVSERLLKVRSPWPVRRNPMYAIVTVQKIARTSMGACLPQLRSRNCPKKLVPVKDLLHVARIAKAAQRDADRARNCRPSCVSQENPVKTQKSRSLSTQKWCSKQ